jgi:hypothetical protein
MSSEEIALLIEGNSCMITSSERLGAPLTQAFAFFYPTIGLLF